MTFTEMNKFWEKNLHKLKKKVLTISKEGLVIIIIVDWFHGRMNNSREGIFYVGKQGKTHNKCQQQSLDYVSSHRLTYAYYVLTMRAHLFSSFDQSCLSSVQIIPAQTADVIFVST